jgi:hypothetical protein
MPNTKGLWGGLIGIMVSDGSKSSSDEEDQLIIYMLTV